MGPNIAASLSTVAAAAPRLPPRPPRVCSDAFRVRPATLPELSHALRRMNCSKASGADGITVSMLKMTFPVIGPHLLHIINRSIVDGQLPAEWKVASVTPLFKSGNVLDVGNYRPVSILPTVSKLAERVVCDQLTDYLVSCDIICPEQHGFRPAHSTESALLDAVSYISSEVDNGRVVSLIAADASKAFDSVEHGRLREKLGWYGIDTWWFSDWLSDRKQVVKGGLIPLSVSHGVVQGSILGPVLFSVFTNDLPSHVPCGKLVMYADDTQFLNTCERASLEDHSAELEAMFSVVQAWYNQNCLKLNPSKTELILFGSEQTRDFSVNFAGASVMACPKVKMLGVMLDSRLQWVDHVSLVVRRCYGTLSGLAKFSHRLPSSVKQLVVESLVFPHILYCVSVWGGCNETQRHRIQKIINHAAQIISGSTRRAHVTPLLAQLKWQNFPSLIRERDIVTVHRLMHLPQAPVSVGRLMTHRSVVSSRCTRATEAGLLQLPRVHSERARRYFTYRAAKLWNEAPGEVREAGTAAICRRRLRAS